MLHAEQRVPVQGARGPSLTTFLKTTQALLLTEAWSRMYTQERKAQVDRAEGSSGALGRWRRRQKPRTANQDAFLRPGAQSSHVSGKFTWQRP